MTETIEVQGYTETRTWEVELKVQIETERDVQNRHREKFATAMEKGIETEISNSVQT